MLMTLDFVCFLWEGGWGQWERRNADGESGCKWKGWWESGEIFHTEHLVRNDKDGFPLVNKCCVLNISLCPFLRCIIPLPHTPYPIELCPVSADCMCVCVYFIRNIASTSSIAVNV